MVCCGWTAPDHQAVVALGIAVVEVKAEDTTVTRHEGGRESRLLVGVEHVCEVERHPKIGQADLLKDQQGRGAVRHETERARLVRLVFDADQAIGIMQSDFPDSRDLVIQQGRVVGLEGIVEAVLAEPERHQAGAGFARCIDAALGEIDGFAPNRTVRMRERAELERRVRVVPHREPVDREAEVPDLAAKRCWIA